MKQERITIWKGNEYTYSSACGFVPFMMSYLHEDEKRRPCLLVVPGGGYCVVSPTEGELVAKSFYENGYNAFVLVYTTNLLMTDPLKLQPLQDISRAVRILRIHAEQYRISADQLAICGFSAGAHLCGSLCVHYADVQDEDIEYNAVSNRPDAAILSYPVITSGEYAHGGSFDALLGKKADKKEWEYMSLEKHVTKDTPPCFLWQTATDESVPVENSYLFAEACKKAGVSYAHHVFSEGMHGLSIANEDWLEGRYGEPYTMEQVIRLIGLIREGKSGMPAELADQIEEQCGFHKNAEELWQPEVKAWLQETVKEAGLWPALAKRWLEKTLFL